MKLLYALCITTITAFTVSALDFTQIATVAARTASESAASRSRQNSAGTATSSEQSSLSTYQPGDYRVRKALHSAEVDFTVDKDNDFRVVWNVGGGRTHQTFINSQTEKFTNNSELRWVWALGYKGKPLPRDTLAEVLRYNAERKIGAWGLFEKAGDWYLRYTLSLPADASGEELKQASQWVAATADEWEKKLMGTDDM